MVCWVVSEGGLPCVAGSSGRQWQCAGAELAAGGAVARTVAGAAAGHGMGLVEEGRETTHWGLAGGMAAGTGGVDVEGAGGPCLVEALGEGVEGGSS